MSETALENQSTVSNENIHVVITKKPHCQIKFDIKVQPEGVKAAYQKALKNVNKEVSIPGFRKGKAPEAMVLEKYASVIQKEFIDLVLQTGFNEALHLTHLHPFREGLVKRPVLHECSQDKGAHFTVEFESRPVVPTVKLDELNIQRVVPTPVTDQERENALQNLLLQFATYDPIEDRPVQEDDFVNVSVTLLEEPPREVVSNKRAQMNAKGLPSWLRKKILGLNAGESAEGMTDQDSTLAEPDPNFTSVPFQVTVHSIWKGHLPAVDEELAKRVGLTSVEDLVKKIDERLDEEVREEAYESEIRAIEHLLVQKYPFDFPQSYIDAHKEARINDYINHIQQKERNFTHDDLKNIEKSIEQSTIIQLQLHYLLLKIAADNHITVDPQDINQELTRQISLISSGRNSVNFNDKDKLQEQLHHLALDRKIKQFLVEHAVRVNSG